ncbi:MAG: hypothetical protein NDI61_04575 [Bdellovibrionaceae bacterium]|nr:hypothetical protein [Pseudobdellovibrionaceae bacterium]
MDGLNILKLIMGVCLMAVAGLAFSIWRDRFRAVKDEERAQFLMYNWAGGVWLFAVFALCGGCYFLLEPLLGQ